MINTRILIFHITEQSIMEHIIDSKKIWSRTWRYVKMRRALAHKKYMALCQQLSKILSDPFRTLQNASIDFVSTNIQMKITLVLSYYNFKTIVWYRLFVCLTYSMFLNPIQNAFLASTHCWPWPVNALLIVCVFILLWFNEKSHALGPEL